MGELSEPIRIGVVGAGNRGRNHANRYERIPGAEVVAVADVDEPRAERIAERHGADHYPSHEALLEQADCDAVNVCVHAALHAEIGIDAAAAGVHVFCEKPMADGYAAARRLREAADDAGVELAVQNQLLYTKETRAARSLVEAGELGDVYHAVAGRSPGYAFNPEPVEGQVGPRRRGTPYVDGYGSPAFVREETAGGGAVYDLGSYTVGQLLYLLGSPTVKRVRGETFQTVPERVADDGEYARRIEDSGYDVEDGGVGFVTFRDGTVLSVRASWARYADVEPSALVGTEGGVRLDPFEYFATVGDVEMRASADLDEYLFREQYLRGERGRTAHREDLWPDPLYHWIESLRGAAASPPTADLALESMVVLDGIVRSASEGRELAREEIVDAPEADG
ncbi:gfo/Idh/MocA family oxidoreductase [Halobacteriales archaeon QS_1_67_19]|nr:MAG: gfo/Idh/MocA family oxidoreductase [Halobacteriales archaeon QS_1_67_19]